MLNVSSFSPQKGGSSDNHLLNYLDSIETYLVHLHLFCYYVIPINLISFIFGEYVDFWHRLFRNSFIIKNSISAMLFNSFAHTVCDIFRPSPIVKVNFLLTSEILSFDWKNMNNHNENSNNVSWNSKYKINYFSQNY